MAVGLGESTPYFLELEALGMVRRTVRYVRETRRNLLTNPSFELGKDGYQSSSSVATISSYGPMVSHGTQAAMVEVFTPDALNVYLLTSAVLDEPVKAGGEWFAARLDARYSRGSRYTKMRFGYLIGTSWSYGAHSSSVYLQSVNESQTYAGLISEGATEVRIVIYLYGDKYNVSPEVGSVFSTDAWALVRAENETEGLEQVGTYFDGDTSDADGWEYQWEGAPNNSTSIAERVEYVDEYGTVEEGAPRVRATIYNIPPNTPIHLQRTADGETQTVQGARRLTATDVATITDWAAPLNRDTHYSVLVNGEPQATATVRVESETHWLQDPINPAGALQVFEHGIHNGAVTMTSESIKTGTYATESTQMMVMGDKYPRHFGGQRQAASGIALDLYSFTEHDGDQVAQMMEDAPILLFRPNRRLRPFAAVSWLASTLAEEPIGQDTDTGDTFTIWKLEADLVKAVTRAATSGLITYDQVQELLGGYTYNEVQAAAAATTYLDWQKNPFIFNNL